MSVIIRLQNLPWAANAADIRQYFQGLSIPEGGVHIVGGEKGDAFISFSTDEDARRAMLSDRGCIKDVQIRLLLSSRNEMQKVIETARQQSMQIQQAYMQLQTQPQISIMSSLPPLTAKVLPQPQQQTRPDLINLMRGHPAVMNPTAVGLISQEKQQQQHQLQQIQQFNLSPQSSENKDRDDKSHKRERTRSKSRDRRSKSSRSGGRRDRSRSKDRRRRDRSRGRDRSRDRHRSNGGGSRNSASRGSGGRSHRSRSPVVKGADDGKAVGEQIKPWTGQFNTQQQVSMADNHQPTTATMNTTGSGSIGSLFSQFRQPPQPPIISVLSSNSYQQPAKNDWTSNSEERQHAPYIPDNDFRTNYRGGSDDEDDRQAEYDNNFHRGFMNNNTTMRRGPPGQDFREQQRFGVNRGARFHKSSMSTGQQNRGGGGHRTFENFGGGGSRFNNHQQQQSRFGSGGGNEVPDNGGEGRPSRFSSIHDGGRPSRFNPLPQSRNNGGPDFEESEKVPPRYNDRYRYDVRNAQAPRFEGLCIEVNNMSTHFSYGDIRKLFEGIHIDGSAIKIQKHRQGVAFVRFDNNNNKNMAMRVNGTAYKGSPIIVKHLDDGAYERENTDDRPYPSSASSAPAVVDHVDLVDLVDDDDDDDVQQPADTNNKIKQEKQNDERSDDDCNLVVCEKSATKNAAVDAGGTGEEQLSSTPQQQQESPTKYLKLKQLPITVTEEDVLNEFDGGGEVRRVTFYPDGEFMGAALEFQNVEAAETALKRFDCVLLGSTPVPVLRCTYKEYVQIKRKSGGGGRRFSNDVGGGGNRHHHNHHDRQQPHHQQQNVPSTVSPKPLSLVAQPPSLPVMPVVRSNCVYVYGLPTTVTNTDITQFFADTAVLPDKIHIMLSKFGRPTGESYCEFGTAQQASLALGKDQCYMGPNLVYVESIGRSEMIQVITKPMQQRNQDISWSGGMRGGGRGGGVGHPRHLQSHNDMMSSSTSRHHQGGPQSYGGGGGGPFSGAGGGGGRPHHQQYMNNGGGRGGGGGGRGGGGVGRGGGNGAGVGYTPRMRGPGPGPNTGPDGFGQPGCVVALDNVPYRADVQEIVDFFEGFDLNSQNVIRRFNDYGKPTGEARVNLRNPQEAIRAIRVLQNKPIFNRPVHLTHL